MVDVISYVDELANERQVHRLPRHGQFVGEYKTPDKLGKVVDLATLVEDKTTRRTTD